MDQAVMQTSAVEPALDERPARWRIGLVALATDHTTERDFASLCPDGEVAIYVNRIAFANPTNVENLRRMQPDLTEAASLILPGEPLDAIAYACTAASVAIGDETVRQALEKAKPGVPAVTPISGAIAGFAALRVRRISVLTPYSHEVSRLIGAYFGAQGLEVLNLRYLDLIDDRVIARVKPEAILRAAVEASEPAAEALFISCTALRSVTVVQQIEDRLGIPVITSNQALFWHALRSAGHGQPIDGCGRLLRLT